MSFYLRPFGDVLSGRPVLLERLLAYAEAFFGLSARALPALPPYEETRVPESGRCDATRWVERMAEDVPADARVYLGVTDADLSSRGVRFVFGESSLTKRRGVFSLKRCGTPDPALFLRRALKLMSHEAGHILGIEHCQDVDCLMRASASMRDHDRNPARLCESDLARLSGATGVDPLSRYRRLETFYRGAGLEDEAAWTRERLNLLVPHRRPGA